jgi:hypothetical protein
MRTLGRALTSTVVAASMLFASPASALTPIEKARLSRGETIVAETTHRHNGGRLVGGVSYAIVNASAEHVSAVFRDPKKWSQILPRVREAKLVSVEKNGQAHVRVTHSLGLFSGNYEVVLAFTDGGRYGRFWVNRNVDNDLNDGWGLVRLTPLPNGKTLVTWAVLFDLGDGVMRSLFESRMQRAALDVPRRLAHAAAS